MYMYVWELRSETKEERKEIKKLVYVTGGATIHNRVRNRYRRGRLALFYRMNFENYRFLLAFHALPVRGFWGHDDYRGGALRGLMTRDFGRGRCDTHARKGECRGRGRGHRQGR